MIVYIFNEGEYYVMKILGKCFLALAPIYC